MLAIEDTSSIALISIGAHDPYVIPACILIDTFFYCIFDSLHNN